LDSPMFGEVFVWGECEPTSVPELCGARVRSLVARNEDSVAVLADGRLFTFGDSGFGTPLQQINSKLADIAYGDGHVVALTEERTVFCAGSNGHGQVGTGAGDRLPVSSPTTPPALKNRRIIAVATGGSHSVCLSDVGDVYTWGRGFEGQLGHGNDQISTMPRYVTAFGKKGKVVSIACGGQNTAAVTESGALYTWGDGTTGQLGYGRHTTQCVPRHVDALEGPVMSLAVGTAHMGVVLASGEVTTWGLNTNCQLGHSFPNNKYMAHPHPPELQAVLEGEEKGKQVSCGAHNVFLVTNMGKVISWGSTAAGLLGYPVRSNTSPPLCVEALRGVHVAQVVCSRQEALAFIPQVVNQITPSLAMQTASTQLTLQGRGFPPNAESCSVCFSLNGSETVVGASYERDTATVYCQAPTFEATGTATLTMSFDGQPYSIALEGSCLEICAEPSWQRIEPTMGPSIGDTEVTIDVQGLVASKAIAARVVGADVSEDAEVRILNEGQILITTPPWRTPEKCHIEVALNGQDFLRVPISFTYYLPPVIDFMRPMCMPYSVPTSVSFLGRDFFDPPEAGQIIVRFAEPDGQAGQFEIDRPGKFRILGEQQEIFCDIPSLEQGASLDVAISLNGGQDFSKVEGKFIAYEPIQTCKTTPSCGPMDGATSVTISGSGIFDSGSPVIRLVDGTRELFCEGTFEQAASDKCSITFITPVWREMPSTPKDAEVAADPDAPPPPTSMAVSVALALNRKNFQPLAVPFTFYEDPSAISSVTPATATLGEECTFVLAGEGIHVSEDMTVKLDWTPPPVDDSDIAPEPVVQIVPLKLQQVEEEGAESQLVFSVPEAVAGEASLQVAVNGQQYIPTELKICWNEA